MKTEAVREAHPLAPRKRVHESGLWRQGVRLLVSEAILFLLACAGLVDCRASSDSAKTKEGPAAESAAATRTAARTAASSTADFGFDLYGRVADRPGNAVFSPYSITSALAMTWAGAAGKTALEMAAVLRLTPDRVGTSPDAAHASFAAVREHLGSLTAAGDSALLKVANRLWGRKGDPWRSPYLALTKTHYGAALEPLDFAREPEPSRARINAWVSEQTEERIPDILAPGMITSATALVLTNAIYFKGIWKHTFTESATRDAPFYRTPEDSVPAPMMSQRGTFGFHETVDLQILELPYTTPGLSMIVLLPRDRDGLPELEEKLQPDTVRAWLGRCSEREVQVFLPRFRFRSEYVLNPTLEAMGMPTAFTTDADFTGMSEQGGLYISVVVHKAFVEVDEKGTEAAAATAVVMERADVAVRVPPPVFRADHPFLFLIVDRETETPLFLGRVADPRG